jgi:hypothetical protein
MAHRAARYDDEYDWDRDPEGILEEALEIAEEYEQNDWSHSESMLTRGSHLISAVWQIILGVA